MLQAKVDSPSIAGKAPVETPVLLASVTDDPQTWRTAVFMLNRSTTEALDVDIELRGVGRERLVVEALELHHANLKAVNTKDAPQTVAPKANGDATVDGDRIQAQLKPLSWTVIVSEATRRDLPADGTAETAFSRPVRT